LHSKGERNFHPGTTRRKIRCCLIEESASICAKRLDWYVYFAERNETAGEEGLRIA
jgi:hypothetical protein